MEGFQFYNPNNKLKKQPYFKLIHIRPNEMDIDKTYWLSQLA